MQAYETKVRDCKKINTTESGVDFLLRMIPQQPDDQHSFSLGLGELKYHDLIHLNASLANIQRYSLTYLINDLLVTLVKKELDPCIFVVDLGYSLNMISVMKEMEGRLTSQGHSSSTVNKLLTGALAKLKSASCTNSTELLAVLASLKEIVVEERIAVIICNTYNLQEDKKLMELAYNQLVELTRVSPVVVIYCYTQLQDIPAPRYLRKPSAILRWSAESKSLTLHRPKAEN